MRELGELDRAASLLAAAAARGRNVRPVPLRDPDLAFVRGFVVGRQWFGGLDVEANLGDSGEVRVLLQAGAMWDAAWGDKKSTLLEHAE